jgi:hypothetical protein
MLGVLAATRPAYDLDNEEITARPALGVPAHDFAA